MTHKPVSNPDCLIVGGGFTGLAAADALARAGFSVEVLERDPTLGGLAGGFDVDGHELEKFYHHWFTNDTFVTAKAAEIGRADNVVVRPSRTGMYFAGGVHRLSTPADLLRFKALPFLDRIRTGLATLWVRTISDWLPLEQYTARDWLRRLFGGKAFEVLWEPLLVGKFGKYADQISAVWFWKKLALRGSSRAPGGREALAYYRGGFAALARDIGASITAHGGVIRTGAAAKTLRIDGEGRIEVTTDAATLRPRTVLLTCHLPDAAKLLEDEAGEEYAQTLRRVKYLANICLILELDRSLSDIYWMNVNDPSFPFVGVIEHTNFEPSSSYGGRHIVYLSKYLPEDDPLYAMSADELLKFAAPYLQRMFPEFDLSWVKNAHAWRAAYAQPIVEKYYSQYMPGFETPLNNVFIATMAQVYPEDRGTNYAIRDGQNAAARIVALIKKPQSLSA